MTGLPGLQSYLVVQPVYEKSDDPRQDLKNPGGLPGLYRVVFTLQRPGFSPLPDRSFSFEGGVEGDSHLAIAPPAYTPPGNDPPVAIMLRARTPDGFFEFRGIPNKKGFLAKLHLDRVQAENLKDAELRAFRALSSSLSNTSVYLDIPLTIYQADITELRTGTASVSFVTPYDETPLVHTPVESMTADFRFYASLY